MRSITGHYTDKFGKQIEFAAQVPADWNELDAQQYSTILQLLTFKNADKFVMGASLLSVLFGPKHWHILKELPDEERHALLTLTNFIMDTPPPAINKFPKLKIRKKECFAPADDLSNIGFGEWCFAYQFYTYYVKFGDIQFLNKLIATLYRPVDPKQKPGTINYKGDIRLPFNENLIEDYARSLKDTEERVKLGILGWLRAAFHNIQESLKNVFPEPDKDEFGNIKETPEGDARTWLDVFSELLGEKWGLVDDLKFTNAIFVLKYLEQQHIEFNKTLKPQS